MTDPTIKFGILKCRDLVNLYYGARLVANVIEQAPQDWTITVPFQLLGQDPRRIRYEIVVANGDAAAQEFQVGSSLDQVSQQGQQYLANPNETIRIVREFLTDLDAVTMPVFMILQSNDQLVSTRETFLTPSPVDEGP